MRCDECGKPKAQVHVTDMSGGKKSERHLCMECAQKLGIAYSAPLSLNTLSELISQVSGDQKQEAQDVPDVTCSVCGMSLAEFQKEGRLGCANDYQAFGEHLTPLLERIHNGVTHVGKVPVAAGTDVKAQTEIRALRAELQKAVNREDYERAASIRDELARLMGEAGESEK